MLAHVRKDEEWIIHELDVHLKGVAKMAGEFEAKLSDKTWVIAASLLHDLGKGSQDFQDYISSKSGYNPEAHIENAREAPGRVIHSTHGANWCYQNWGPQIGKILAYLIAGHHGGLPDWNHKIGVGGNLEHRLDANEIKKLPKLTDEFILKITQNVSIPAVPKVVANGEEEQFHLWIRMLYSCLVDADFLDTERFMDPEKFDSRGEYASLIELKILFDIHM